MKQNSQLLFANNIKKLRCKRLLNIKEVSQKTGISENYLTKIEKGTAKRILFSHIESLCKYFKVSIYELFD